MTSSYLRLALAVAVATGLALPAAAGAAAPDRTVVLSAQTAKVSWEGAPGSGLYEPSGQVDGYDPTLCDKSQSHYCDISLLDVRSGGPVALDVLVPAVSNADFDVYIYKSDAQAKVGEQLENEAAGTAPPPFGSSGTGQPTGFDEHFSKAAVEPGYYVMVVAYYQSFDAGYKADAEVKGATPVAGGGTTTPPPSGGGTTPPPSGGGTTPPPPPSSSAMTLPFKAPSTLGSAKKAKKAKSLTFKATAGEPITNLTLTLFQKVGGKNKVFGTLKVKALKKGSTKLKMKVKGLKAGLYSLQALGTVNGQSAGAVQNVKIKK